MQDVAHWQVVICPEHSHQLGRGDRGEWLCREGHEVQRPTALAVVRSDLLREAKDQLEQVRLYAEKMRRDRDLNVRASGEDLLQIIGATPSA